MESGQYTSTEAFKFSIPVRAVYFVRVSCAKIANNSSRDGGKDDSCCINKKCRITAVGILP